MNGPPAASGLGLGGRGHRRGGRKRSLADTFLIAVWVVGYTLVLWAFRAAKAMEDMLATHGGAWRAAVSHVETIFAKNVKKPQKSEAVLFNQKD
jgi:hypothetical protein